LNSTVSPQNILRHELVGLPVNVVKCTDPNFVGLAGVVVDETKNMIVLNAESRVKVSKRTATFRFTLPDGAQVDVDGTRLVGRPEDRLKTKVIKW
jgi:ribonuclease P protein subunit POP4